MSDPAHKLPAPDLQDPYEAACDQAIAMCNGSMRGAIKVLIMANEYLEAELLEAQTAASKGFGRGRHAAEPATVAVDSVPPNRVDWYD
ncbi:MULTISPECIES: hypothetical protein [Rhodopseudomonas]|uniref:Uncharacterized protein n=1 Tax=Rhodopseudomonas palustris TaxID=1076 RepID=A0A0D7E5W6_RHOPL|nr:MULTISPECIES: hypothetical protein [Rhodopseudomonas]KIZ36208.1 hypothetical protein OO17_24995 [Rhodopseudomonas palustris]MDF3809134.1 hypothetical protein [Rhodopseudomonas sp. BAL398]WOK19414.1 hypothetical protein RBJ75_07835 [Rhodopseudomonas sp. BAL398]